MNVVIREYSRERDNFNFINLVKDFFNEQRVIAGKAASFTEEDAIFTIENDFVLKDGNLVFVAEVKGILVGFARIKKSEGSWFLREINVVKEERQKGIGSLLFNKLVGFLKLEGENAFYINVVPRN